jgi:hypothetical protein
VEKISNMDMGIFWFLHLDTRKQLIADFDKQTLIYLRVFSHSKYPLSLQPFDLFPNEKLMVQICVPLKGTEGV